MAVKSSLSLKMSAEWLQMVLPCCTACWVWENELWFTKLRRLKITFHYRKRNHYTVTTDTKTVIPAVSEFLKTQLLGLVLTTFFLKLPVWFQFHWGNQSLWVSTLEARQDSCTGTHVLVEKTNWILTLTNLHFKISDQHIFDLLLVFYSQARLIQKKMQTLWSVLTQQTIMHF